MFACGRCNAKLRLITAFAWRGIRSETEKECISSTPSHRGYQIIGRPFRHPVL